MINKIALAIFSLIALSLYSYSQQDFNNFKTLKSAGDVPNDFLMKTSEKVEESLRTIETEMTAREEVKFVEGVNYNFDDLLHSGLVMYGDEITEYINDVADKVLKSEPKLRRELRFYTIKSNATNALSTSQGIILVTTGLISQLTNEAQLAYILAHEVAHFKERHVIETFEKQSARTRYNDRIQSMANYSKEKEFEADFIGTDIYSLAGYAREHITSVFDVLMYSYLPIDEIFFPKDYFNTDLCYIPEERFTDESYPIQVVEDYDDTYSSHPNIRKRKEKALEAAKDIIKWGDATYYLGEDRFKYVRQLARFESLRTDLLNAQYGNALYTIFVLEKEFPESVYLHRMKAQAWLGLMAYKAARDVSETIKSKKYWEGESARLYDFLKKLDAEELEAIAMRIIEDCRKQFPEDKELNAIWKKAVYYLDAVDDFSLSNYSKISFYDAVLKAEDSGNEEQTEEVVENEEKKEQSKYDRIRAKKDLTNPENLDTNKYYRYLLSDLMDNDEFLAQMRKCRDKRLDKKEKQAAYDELSKKEKKRYDKEHAYDQRADLSKFILVEPYGVKARNNMEIKYAKTEELQETFKSASVEAAKELGLETISVSKFDLAQGGTKMFNDKNVFTSFLIQVSQKREIDVFPVDYSILNELKSDYDTKKLVFSIVEHQYHLQFTQYEVLLMFALPAIPYRFVNLLFKGNDTEINMIVLDIDKVEIETGFSRVYRDPINFYSLKAHMMDIYNQLNTK